MELGDGWMGGKGGAAQHIGQKGAFCAGCFGVFGLFLSLDFLYFFFGRRSVYRGAGSSFFCFALLFLVLSFEMALHADCLTAHW